MTHREPTQIERFPAWPPPNNPRERLTALQRTFIDWYILTANATQSYLKASPRSTSPINASAQAHALLRQQRIQNAIARRREQVRQYVALDQESVKQRLEEIYQRALNASDLDPTNANLLDKALKAAQLMGQTTALFSEKSIIETNAELTPEQRAEILEEISALQSQAGFTRKSTDEKTRH